MFETTAVESRVHRRSATRAVTLPVSLGVHALAVSTFIAVGVWSVAFPLNSPPQISALVLSAPLPKMLIHRPKPVEPEPAEAKEPPKGEVAPASKPPVVDAPPIEIPDSIPVLTANQNTVPLPPDVVWGDPREGSNKEP